VLQITTEQNLQPNTAATEVSSTYFFIPFKSLSNKSTVSVTAVPIHISTPHQQKADKLSVPVLDPLHTIMQRTFTEINAAGA